MKVAVAVKAVSPEGVLGQQWEDHALLADHAANKGVDGDKEAELGEVGA